MPSPHTCAQFRSGFPVDYTVRKHLLSVKQGDFTVEDAGGNAMFMVRGSYHLGRTNKLILLDSSGNPLLSIYQQSVQCLIERCLQLYMSRKEVVETLADQAKIEPIFTNIVWQRLEEQNTEFFKAYHARLMVKHHIDVFNNLLKKQVDLMRNMYSPEAAPVPTSGASRATSLQQQSSGFYGVAAADLINNRTVSLANGITSLNPNVHTNWEPCLVAGDVGTPQNTFVARSQINQGSNGIGVNSEPVVAVSSHFEFGSGSNKPVSAPLGTFTNIESDMDTLCDLLLQSDGDDCIGHLCQNPPGAFTNVDSDMDTVSDLLLQSDAGDFIDQFCPNFSHSDLTVELAHHGK